MTTKIKLSPEMEKDLSGLTSKEFLEKYPDWNYSRLHNIRQRRGIKQTDETHVRANAERGEVLRVPIGMREDVVFEDPVPDRMTWEAFDEMYSAVAEVKAVEKKYDPRKHQLAFRLTGDKPIGILFTGDWQLGSEGVDYDLWRSDFEIVEEFRKENPGALYGIGLGDYASHLGLLNIQGSQNRDIVKSGDQYIMMQQYFHLTNGFWLILVQGCHDTFVAKRGAIDTVERYCELAGARHGWHGVLATIGLGGEKYTARLRHKFPFTSKINVANSPRRQIEMEGPADIVAHGHLHSSFTFDGQAGGGDVTFVRCGSYQIHDDFARQQVGNVKADPRQPMVIIYPDRHEVWSTRDFRTGLNYLREQRGEYA